MTKQRPPGERAWTWPSETAQTRRESDWQSPTPPSPDSSGHVINSTQKVLPTHTWTLAHSERRGEGGGEGAHNRCMPHCGTVRHACKHYHFWLKTRQLPQGHEAVQAVKRGGAEVQGEGEGRDCCWVACDHN